MLVIDMQIERNLLKWGGVPEEELKQYYDMK